MEQKEPIKVDKENPLIKLSQDAIVVNQHAVKQLVNDIKDWHKQDGWVTPLFVILPKCPKI